MEPEFEFQLGSVCNNRCNFCSSGQFTELRQGTILPLEDVLSALDDAYERGFRKVTFLGGEPTLYKTFLPALRHSVDLGFSEIVIFTNGVKARNPKWVRQVLSLGDFTWRFSIQGGNEAAHDQVTTRKGAFERIVAGITNVSRFPGQRITGNMCVNQESYRSLPDLPSLTHRLKVSQMCIDTVRPSGTGDRTDDYLAGIIPRYSDMAPFIDEMLTGFESDSPNCEVNLTNFPYCLAPQWAYLMSHGGEATATNTFNRDEDGSRDQFEIDKYAFQKSDRVHPPGCEACVFRPLCAGIPEKYIELYGDEELRAVTRAEAEALDAGKDRLFTLLARQWIDPILEADGSGEWVLGPPQGNNRDGRLDVRCDHPLGSVFLGFSPPGRRSPDLEPWEPIVESDRFDLRVMMMPGGEDAPIAELAEWAQGVCSEMVAVKTQRKWRSKRRLTRRDKAFRAMGKMVRAVTASGDYSGWKQVRSEVGYDKSWVELSSGDNSFRLILEPGLTKGTSLVGARFETSDLPEDVVRAPIEAIASVLTRSAQRPAKASPGKQQKRTSTVQRST